MIEQVKAFFFTFKPAISHLVAGCSAIVLVVDCFVSEIFIDRFSFGMIWKACEVAYES